MDFNYTLKFRTFDQLLEDVTIDLNTYALENLIEPQQLIKVAKRVTYDLGLRINMTKEQVRKASGSQEPWYEVEDEDLEA